MKMHGTKRSLQEMDPSVDEHVYGPQQASIRHTIMIDTSGIDFQTVSDANKREFFKIIEGRPGKKAILWDPVLMPRISLVTGYPEIRHGVVTMREIRNEAFPSFDTDHVLFIIRPESTMIDLIIKYLQSYKQRLNYVLHLLLVPTGLHLCEYKLQAAGIKDHFETVENIPIFFFNLDVDVLTLECDNILKDCIIHEDKSALFTLSSALLQLQAVYGRFKAIYYKGDSAQYVAQLLKKRQAALTDVPPHSCIDNVILFDRSVDYITPMVTQLTYEGLIDELFGIRCGSVTLPKEKFVAADSAALPGQANKEQRVSGAAEGSGPQADKKVIPLNSNDDLFAELRDLNISAVGSTLSRTAKALNEQIDLIRSAQTIGEIKEGVKRLPQVQAARQIAGTHTAIAEMIKETTTTEDFIEFVQCEQDLLSGIDTALPQIEDAIACNKPIFKVLRLICLQSQITDGLKPKVFEQYRKEILQSYGYSYLPLMLLLEKAGLLKQQAKGATSALKFGDSFMTLQKSLRLIVDNINEQTPQDMAYVYSGYAPIIPRLCQYFSRASWQGIQDYLKRLPGAAGSLEPTSEEEHQSLIQKLPLGPLQSVASKVSSAARSTTLVVFIGGVTMAEISALRYLTSKEEEMRFLIATTSVVTGTRLLQIYDELHGAA